jgi:hypothetical protein
MADEFDQSDRYAPADDWLVRRLAAATNPVFAPNARPFGTVPMMGGERIPGHPPRLMLNPERESYRVDLLTAPPDRTVPGNEPQAAPMDPHSPEGRRFLFNLFHGAGKGPAY